MTNRGVKNGSPPYPLLNIVYRDFPVGKNSHLPQGRRNSSNNFQIRVRFESGDLLNAHMMNFVRNICTNSAKHKLFTRRRTYRIYGGLIENSKWLFWLTVLNCNDYYYLLADS